jgi:predicted negative regulator of RcsB-dependent stress response
MTQNGPLKNQPPTGSFSEQASVPTQKLLVVKGPAQPGANPSQHTFPSAPAAPAAAPNHGRLEDDEISTFFRNRRMIAQGTFGMNPILKLLIYVLILRVGILCAWNYYEPFRSRGQSFILASLNYDIAAVMPVWTKKAKAFKKQIEASRKESVATGGLLSVERQALDDEIQLVIAGQWPRVDTFNQARCYRWQATHECAVRAFSSAYRGMKSAIRPAAGLDVSMLSQRDRLMFGFGVSLLSNAGASFPGLMAQVQRDPILARLLFDARLKIAARDGSAADVAVIMPFMPSKGVAEQDVAKWRALEFVGRSSQANMPQQAFQQSKKAMSQYLDKFGANLNGDPVALILIGNTALKMGLQKNLGATLGSFESSGGMTSALDPSLLRSLTLLRARVFMAEGRLPEAERLLAQRMRPDAADAESEHLLGSVLLESRNPAKNAEAAKHFAAAMKSQARWESTLGLLLALTRGGQIKEGAPLVQSLRKAMKTGNELWITLGVAEYKLMASKGLSPEAQKATASEQARVLGQLYQKFSWSNRAGVLYVEALRRLGRVNEAEEISSKIDDVWSKTSYLSSPEFMGSPTGPLALTR